jgi:hypothetical protein
VPEGTPIANIVSAPFEPLSTLREQFVYSPSRISPRFFPAIVARHRQFAPRLMPPSFLSKAYPIFRQSRLLFGLRTTRGEL